MPGKPPAFHPGKPLAERVDLHNVRPAAEQLGGDVLQFLRRHGRRFKQGAAAAGQQEQHRILRGEVRGHGKGAFGGAEAVLVRHGMTRLANGEIADGAAAVPVLGNDDAPVNPRAQNFVRRVCHGPCRLACRHKEQASGGKALACQGPLDGLARQHMANGFLYDKIAILPQ